MKIGDSVYSYKHNCLGTYQGSVIQSGYNMAVVEYDNNLKDYEYHSQLLSLEDIYNNTHLWNLAEKDLLPKGTIIEDQQGNQMIYTGNTFQIYYTEANENKKYVGFCKGDKWSIVFIDESKL